MRCVECDRVIVARSPQWANQWTNRKRYCGSKCAHRFNYKKNRSATLKALKERYWADPEYRAKLNAYSRAYLKKRRREHPILERRIEKANRIKYLARVLAFQAAYRQKNRELLRVKTQEYKNKHRRLLCNREWRRRVKSTYGSSVFQDKQMMLMLNALRRANRKLGYGGLRYFSFDNA